MKELLIKKIKNRFKRKDTPLPRGYDKETKELDYKNISFEEARQLTIDKICRIAGIDSELLNEDFRNTKIDYITERVPWVRKNTAFFLKGQSIQEAEAAIAKGAVIIISQQQMYNQNGEPLPCIVVENPLACFYKVNAWLINLYEAKVVSITGSVGKTTTKEMIYHVVKDTYKSIASPQNTNSRSGISNTLQKLEQDTEVYIQEVGAWEKGYIKGTSSMLNADIGIVTNVGYPHIDLYGSIENIFDDKTSLIDNLAPGGVAFINYDDDRLSSYKSNKRIISFAIYNKDADYVANDIECKDNEMSFTIHSKEEDIRTTIFMYGEHNILNALVAYAVGRELGIDSKVIIERLRTFRSEGLRQNVCNVGGYNLYMDCYNSAPNSILTSVHALSIMEPANSGKKIAVLGDIPRLGDDSIDIHKEVGKKLVNEEIDLYIFFGNYAEYLYDVMKASGCNVMYAKDRDMLNKLVSEHASLDDIILFKAGHPMALAKTVDSVFGTSFHLTDGDVLLENSKDVSTEDYNARWIDGFVEIRKNKSKDNKLVIPEKMADTNIGRIGKEAFQFDKFESITIPETVFNIGYAAFYKCENLKNVTLQKGLKVLERSAFNGCISLESIALPEGTIEVGERAFYNCNNLKEIIIPESVGNIYEDTFEGCKILTIKCTSGSYAENYARANNIRFELI